MKKAAVITYDLDWIFSGGVNSGGASVVNKNLILELAKNEDIELTIFCMPTDFVPADNITVIPISAANGIDSYIKDIEKRINESNFDIVLTVSLEYMNKNPFLQSQSFIHRCNVEPFGINIIKKILGRKKIKHQDKQFKNLDKDNKYFAVSNSVKKDYAKNYGLNPKNIYVCYPGTAEVFETQPIAAPIAAPVSAPIAGQKDFITFGCVANNSVNKGGLLFILGLFALKLKGVKDFKGLIISSKFKQNTLINCLIKILCLEKNIEFIEQQEDMSNFYKNIDCLVLPSKNEAFGLVVLEAMAYGKPSIVSSTAGVSEIITKENGIVFERKSFINFVQSLKNMYEAYKTDSYIQMASNAFETSKKYSWKNFAQNVLEKFN